MSNAGCGLYFSIWTSVGGSRSRANVSCGRKASDGSRAINCRWTPSLISVLGLRLWVCPLACRLHDDRWGDLLLNTDAAARSFEAVQLGEENLSRWQQGASGSRPLPGSLSTSSCVLGSAIEKRTNAFPKVFEVLLRKRPSQALPLTVCSGSLMASSPSSRKV